MKMNKLAAGALALALGLGAVAPAVAAEKKDNPVPSYVLEQYEKEAKNLTAKRKAAIDAQMKIDAAKAAKEKAAKELAEAKKAYEAQFKPYLQYIDVQNAPRVIDVEALAKKPVLEAAKKLEVLLKAGNTVNSGDNNINDAKAGIKNKETYRSNVLAWAKLHKLSTVSDEALSAAVERFCNALYQFEADVKDAPRLQSVYQRYLTAQYAYDEAVVRLREVEEKYGKVVREYDITFERASKLAQTYGYVVQVYNNGVQIVKEGDPILKAARKEYNLKDLAAAKKKAETTLEAVALLKKLAPQKLKGVEAKVDELVKDCEKLIKLADKYLAPKAAFVATAYADEEKEPSVDELTKQLNEKSDKIQDLISDKKEAPVEEEKKPEEKKPEEKKPEENKPSRRAGNNARTGIAGIAGVAGILAAASVAYAASKRD